MKHESDQTVAPPVLNATPVEAVSAELAWRASAWRTLRSSHPGLTAPAAVIRALGLYNGYRGVWVDKKRTASAWSPNGITIGVRHDGSSYADRLSATGLIYKFPQTEMPGYDEMEVEATRTAMRLGLPIFVVSGHKDAPTRDVRMAYVEGCNTEACEFLLVFVDDAMTLPTVEPSGAAFGAWIAERISSRMNERRFAFEVVERYGPACAVCAMAERTVLHSAHLRPRFADGTDDPANGLVLCANHHLAMDAGLWRIDPNARRVVPRPGGSTSRGSASPAPTPHICARNRIRSTWNGCGGSVSSPSIRFAEAGDQRSQASDVPGPRSRCGPRPRLEPRAPRTAIPATPHPRAGDPCPCRARRSLRASGPSSRRSASAWFRALGIRARNSHRGRQRFVHE